MTFNRYLITMILGASIMQAGFDDKVRADFFAGFAGDRAALDRAMSNAQTAIEQSPNEAAEALAWHGGGLLFQAGLKFQLGDAAAGGDLWGRGVGELEKAGAQAPDNPAVLVPRAAVWFAVSRQSPPAMGRPLLKKALADYEHVYELQSAYFEKLSTHMRSELLFGMADGYARDENPVKARVYFAKLAAIGPASGHLQQAELFLQGERYEVKGIGCAGCHTGK